MNYQAIFKILIFNHFLKNNLKLSTEKSKNGERMRPHIRIVNRIAYKKWCDSTSALDTKFGDVLVGPNVPECLKRCNYDLYNCLRDWITVTQYCSRPGALTDHWKESENYCLRLDNKVFSMLIVLSQHTSAYRTVRYEYVFFLLKISTITIRFIKQSI